MTKAINTALLSYGLSGKVFHAPFIHANPGFRLMGAWERSKNLIEKDYPGSRVYRSLQEILDDPAVKLVIVNTPTFTHAEFAEKALRAGKHVVVEKAFTTNAKEAAHLVGLAKDLNLVLSVYQNRRYDSGFLTVRKVVESGKLGELVEARFCFERFNPVLSQKSHREEPGPGAGNLMDLGPHLIDGAMVLFGKPQAVFADIRMCRPETRVDDYFELLLYYPSLRVKLFSSYLVRNPSPGFVLHGTKGSFVKSRADVQEDQLRKGGKPEDAGYGVEPEGDRGILTSEDGSQRTIVTEKGNYAAYFSHLHKALTENTPPPVTGEEGLLVMQVLDAARESSQTRKLVSL